VFRPPMSHYRRTNGEHWLRDKQKEGQSLILEDDSTWEVYPSDRSKTARWLRGSTIHVEDTKHKRIPICSGTALREKWHELILGEFRVAC